MTGRDSMLRAGVTTFAGVVLGALSTFVLTGVISNGLGAAAAGAYFQAIALFAIATSALQLGADTALVRTLSRQTALGERAALRPTVATAILPVLAAALLGAAALWAAADPIAQALAPEDAARTAELVRTLAPFLPSSALLVVLLGGTRGVGSTLPYTLLFNVALPLLRLAAGAGAVLLGVGLQSLLAMWAAPLVPLVAVAAVLLAIQIRGLRASGAAPAPALPAPPTAFWRFALPRGAATILERGLDWGGVLLVLAIAGPVQGAVYAVVNRCASAGSMIDQAARVVTGPRISRALAVGDHAAAERMFLGVTRSLILLSWPFYLTLAIFSPAVLGLFGPEFRAGAPALAVASLSLMLATSAGMVQSILLMGGRSSWQLLNRIAQLATLLGVTWALVPSLGIVGAALGWTAAIVLDTALAATQVAVRMRIRSSVRLIALPAGTALLVVGGVELAAVTVFGPSLLTLAITLPVIGGVYLAALWLLRERLGLSALTGRATPTQAPHQRGASTRLPSDRPSGALGLERVAISPMENR